MKGVRSPVHNRSVCLVLFLFLCLVFVSSVTSDLQKCNNLENAISKSTDDETDPEMLDPVG